MTYDEAIDFYKQIKQQGSKPGLERIRALLERMGNPQNKLKFVHVAGTNGKGSTSTMISNVLYKSGLNVGLYISPYVIEFRERIQFNTEMISEDELAKSTETVKKYWEELVADGITPTEFEVFLAVALDYYVRQNCDVVVLEVGLGGRLDATNIIDVPLCSVITVIDFDHTEILGNTLDDIATEKCGIIKKNGVTVSYPEQPQQAMNVIEKVCNGRGNRLFVGTKPEVISCNIYGSEIKYDGLDIKIPLAGEHQILNTVTVIEAIKALRTRGLNINDDAIVDGIAMTALPARFEILCEKPLVILDGAHNLSGIKSLVTAIKTLDDRRVHLLFSCLSDKMPEKVLAEILPLCHDCTVFGMKGERAMPANEIARIAFQHCENVYIAGTPSAAIIQPFSHLRGDDVLIISGSLYFASEIRPVAYKLFDKLKNLDRIRST